MTIFVILGILIVVAGVLIYLFVPGIKSTLTGVNENPNVYLQNCLEDDLINNVQTISLQGGNLNPENSYLYEDSNLSYLCYTSDYYENCVVQEPFIKEHIEDELTTVLKPKVTECINSMKESYEKKGYTVSISSGTSKVMILPEKTVLQINQSLSMIKKDSKNYDQFNVVLNNNLYEVLGVVRSIIDYESTLGQAETTELMSLYRDLKVEKLKQTDGTKVYVITNKPTGDVFQFATRSQVFPPGYA